MIAHYLFDGQVIDSVDLKALLLTRGVKVDGGVYDVLASTARLSTQPLDATAMFLPDGTVVHLIDLSFHLGHLKEILKPGFLGRLGAVSHMNTPFRLKLVKGQPVLHHDHRPVTRVLFPPPTDFYGRFTASGLPYRGHAVLQGREWLSFPCLWHCEYAAKGEPCQFCHAGAEHQSLAKRGRPMPRVPTPDDVAEITAHAIGTGLASGIQLTGGSTFKPEGEIDLLCRYLEAIFSRTPRESFVGETLVYTTPPVDETRTDALFERGASRVAFSLEVWDEALARTITPGKAKHTTRERHLKGLRHIAHKYGPNKACCNFIIGLEDAASLLDGARTLASEGIVPVASIWIPFGMPVAGKHRAPGLDYYRRVKEGLAEIYQTHGIEPPGGQGLNVCMCRDVATHRASVQGGHHPTGCLCNACLEGFQDGRSPLPLTPSALPAVPVESRLADPADSSSPVRPDVSPDSNHGTLELTLFGNGCIACDTAAQRTLSAARDVGRPFTLRRIDDLEAILTAGIGATPALRARDQLLFWGRIPTVDEIRVKLQSL